MQVIVQNNMQRAIAYSATVESKAGHPRVQIARVLYPGSNQLDAAEFTASTKKSPVWAKWIEDGEVIVRGEGNGLADMSPAEALTVIRDTLNQELLDTWAAEETRPEMKKAIAKQHKKLEEKLSKAAGQAA